MYSMMAVDVLPFVPATWIKSVFMDVALKFKYFVYPYKFGNAKYRQSSSIW
jgi:hypothetical protein